ncbi:hypothetical protein C823_002463 [Eubacterium plexicaudatum ASF492]|uniref:Uncharacterized protein n=1 Tax=Eubacterium plexicaudatum ASF492 TaxID=1235802 RepID=N2A8N2_9FIRM|nr:hypothetical protein C823_002463 [Eubacterium plexicaudatum ASF492]
MDELKAEVGEQTYNEIVNQSLSLFCTSFRS